MPIMESKASYNTYIPLPYNSENGKNEDCDAFLSLVPIRVVTNACQLPTELLHPCPEKQMVVGFDCEGVNLSRHGDLCIMQIAAVDAIYIVDAIQGGEELMNACKPALESPYITKIIHDCKRDSEALYFQFGIKLHNVVDTQIAYTLLEEQQGWVHSTDDCISFIGLLADPRYCGISYLEKKELRGILKKDPNYWTYRPFTEQMVNAAIDDVRFLPYVCHKMMEKLNEVSLCKLAIRGTLHCRCFCTNDNGYVDWSPIPSIPGGKFPEMEILSVIDVPPGKMGCIIGKKGISIQSIKESCNAEIVMGGDRGPFGKVFVIGTVGQVRKAEAILRGRMQWPS